MKNDLKLVLLILDTMHEYQKKNNIKDECVTNAQYLYDVLKHNTNLDVKVKAVYVLFNYDHETTGICCGHLCLQVEGVIFDPSYQYSKIKGAIYTDSFKKVNEYKSNLDSVSKSQILKQNLQFQETANQINSGLFCVPSKDYYHAQADYCESKEV
jgi:methionine salvage enolase-phosphatase E1